ncbi:hypothetical protein GCM10027275_25760 [Rhabdobacter roseus]|uniref:Uncharacterized protein n=1 Tax=Rhabdobacter roseus TaxID=1655419 RepID=A0A840TSH5_9BACT|nr:hypothetical protein [Rhabdobacter roseus]MBB5284522.1 hypothetical protein [Rhabdobacter roseus]
MKPYRKLLTGIALALPLIFWWYVLLRYSINVPWFDDFEVFPDFLRQWLAAESLGQHWQLLIKANNEHRMVFAKLLTAGYFSFTQSLNFTFLHVAGAFFTMGTFWILWRVFQESAFPAWYFIPAAFLLFQLQPSMIFLWAICGLQHQPVVFFVCLSMYLLARNRLGWAILAAVCASFAMSSGLFVWTGGVAILLLRSQYRYLAAWVGTALVSGVLYFRGMETQGNEESISFFMQHPHLSFLGFFAFLGGLFDFAPERSIEVRTAVPILVAIVLMTGVLAWLLGLVLPWIRNNFGKNLQVPGWLSKLGTSSAQRPVLRDFTLGLLFFLLANAAIIGFLRPRFGFMVMVVSNYKIYPALFLITCYLAWLNGTYSGTRQKKGVQAALVLSMGIWAMSMLHYLPGIIERRKNLLVSAYNQEHHAFGLGFQPGSEAAQYTDDLMKDVTQRGIYTYPREFDGYFNAMLELSTPYAQPDDIQTEVLEDIILIQEPRGWNTSLADDDGTYVFLRNQENFYPFKMNQNLYMGRNPFIRYEEGMKIEIPRAAIAPGTYEVGFFKIRDGSTQGGIVRSLEITRPN